MRFKEFLRRTVGRRDYADNLPIFKAFWAHVLKSARKLRGASLSDECVEFEVSEFIDCAKANGVDAGTYHYCLREMPIWRKDHRIRPQRIEAAKSRWLKESRRKLLTLLVWRISAVSHGRK